MTNNRCLTLLICLGMIPAMAMAAGSAGQDSASTIQSEYGITLNNHRFIPSSRIYDPFITTYLRNSLGVGRSADLNIPVINLEDQEIIALQGQVAYAEIEFEYRFAIKDWIAFWFTVEGYGRLGTRTMSFLVSGVNTAFSFELGWLLRLYKNDRNLLSGAITMYNQSYTDVNIIRFLEGIVSEDKDKIDYGLSKNTPSFRMGIGLRYAHAFNEVFGIQAVSELQIGEPIDRRSKNVFSTQFGLSGDMDFMHLWDIPVGLILSYNQYSYDKSSENVLSIPREITVGIAFTGREDFSLSLDLVNYWYESERIDTRLRLITTIVTLTYYF